MTDDELIVMAAHALADRDSNVPVTQAKTVVNLIAPIVRADEREKYLDTLADVVNQVCYDGRAIDSMALSTYADAIRLLSEAGRVRIEHHVGRRVIAQWVRE